MQRAIGHSHMRSDQFLTGVIMPWNTATDVCSRHEQSVKRLYYRYYEAAGGNVGFCFASACAAFAR
jgi:hypothetical protein